METFRTLVNAILENNRINQGKWSDWEDAKHIQRVYGAIKKDKMLAMHEAMLNEAISSDGLHLQAYLDLIEIMDYGV